MTDIFTRQKRSEIMSRVKNKNTDIELKLRRILYAHHIYFRVKNKLVGKPDIVLAKYKIAIFCDGDFWHGKNYSKEHERYSRFWREKIKKNMERDKAVTLELKKQGWKVLRFWKADINKKPEKCLYRLEKTISSVKKQVQPE